MLTADSGGRARVEESREQNSSGWLESAGELMLKLDDWRARESLYWC